jgi:hypothetical protein
MSGLAQISSLPFGRDTLSGLAQQVRPAATKACFLEYMKDET